MAVNEKQLFEVAQRAVQDSLRKSGILREDQKLSRTQPLTSQKLIETVALKTKELIKEALIVLPKSFSLKTEWLSAKTKEAHDRIYKGMVERFNLTSAKLDSVSREDIPEIRHLKTDEVHNLNGIKLHELYFDNIADPQSQIHRDSIPFMRLSRDWGTFENWQFDFRATAMASREGWAVLFFDPYKDKYLHAMVDENTMNIPVCGIPILVLDMWSHAYFHSYQDNKKDYINAMMRELNWNIIEARMVVAERANLKDLYLVRPLINNEPQKMIDQAQNTAPIGKDQVAPGGIEAIPAPGSDMQVNPRPPVGGQQSGGV